MIDKKILHYKIIEKLGEGGMGVVYLAEDTKLKRQVAIKFLPPQMAVNNEERARFKIEAQAAAALNHPNITQIYAIEEANENIFLTMEYVKGQELKEEVRSRKLEVKEVIEIASQIAKGLQAAHEKEIVHRDIKTSNIMITNDGQVKIMDFGLAKLSGTGDLTKTSSTLGTTAYMSPEQVRGEVVDKRSDIWSFGVVLFEMLTGEHPFKGDYEAAIIYEILNEQPQDITSLRPEIQNNISQLISNLLKKDADQRMSDCLEIIARLDDQPQKEKLEVKDNSIAVLYFENMSPDKDNDYFCAGMTEDIIIDLSKIHDIRVVPRSDVLPFSDNQVNSRKAGEILNVAYILEGSVRKAGKQLRITAQLIDVKTGFQVWAERYDRMMEDIFEIQMEVAEKITGAMKISLTDSEKESLAQKPTEDLRAYDFYLRGRDFLLAHGENNNNNAIKMFELALSIDPNYALVYVGLSEAYGHKFWAFDGDKKWIDKMKAMINKALELDPNLIEAQFGNGLIAHFRNKYDQSIQIFNKIIEWKNDFYPAHHWSGVGSEITKDYKVAIAKFRKAADLKPYNEEPWVHIGNCYYQLGDMNEGKKADEQLLDIVRKKLEINANDTIALSRMAASYAKQDQKEKALEIVQKLTETASTDGLAMYNCACTYALLSYKKESLELLDKALQKGYKNIITWVEQDVDFNSIREEEEFKILIKKYTEN
jgi:serine/threonine protein kinase/Tfp pilus assembly protein PilF